MVSTRVGARPSERYRRRQLDAHLAARSLFDHPNLALLDRHVPDEARIAPRTKPRGKRA